jgi:hypothetical protein
VGLPFVPVGAVPRDRPVFVFNGFVAGGHGGPPLQNLSPILLESLNLERRNTMKNVDMKVEGNILTLKIDLSKEFGPSSSGKTIIIASTEGNISVPDRDEKVGLNVYKKK